MKIIYIWMFYFCVVRVSSLDRVHGDYDTSHDYHFYEYHNEDAPHHPPEHPAINGGWSKWKKFGSCSVTCGEGIIPIIRTCDNPKPENDGRFCEGDTNDFGTCSLGACPGENLALHKKTQMSSKYKPNKFLSTLATDGVNIQSVVTTCTHTKKDAHSWLAVDLGETYEIRNVVLYGRTDCCTDRLKNFDINVYKPKSKTTEFSFQNVKTQGEKSKCHYQHHKVPINGLNATCAKNTIGQIVEVYLHDRNYLTLCEIEVYGKQKQHLFDEKNFSYNEPYQGKRVRKVKTTKESACTKACKLEGNKPGCVASFYTNQKVCFFAGSSGGETAAAHKGN